jgi:hypothetical protein
MEGLVGYGSSDEDATPSSVQQAAGPGAKRMKLSIEEHDTASQQHSGDEDSSSDSEPRSGSPLADTSPTPPACHDLPNPLLPSAADLLSGAIPLDMPCPIPSLPMKDRHQGRKRNFEHVEGNFATVVYIPVDSNRQLLGTLREAYSHIQDTLPSLVPLVPELDSKAATKPVAAVPLPSSGPGPFPLHVSLSRTVPIKATQMHSLISTLQDCLGQALDSSRASQRFTLHGLECYVNDFSSRTFAAVEVADGKPAVLQMIAAVDESFRQHGLQEFYDEPRPHMSFAWVLGDESDTMKAALQQASGDVTAGAAVPAVISTVMCRVGQKDYLVWPRR